MNEKCFCHVEIDGERIAVKDSQARADAAAAVKTANEAKEAVNAAADVAALRVASEAKDIASEANAAAANANSVAAGAVTTSANALNTANAAKTIADAAKTTADNVDFVLKDTTTLASAASNAASEANARSIEAKNTADAAKTTAENIAPAANEAKQIATELKENSPLLFTVNSEEGAYLGANNAYLQFKFNGKWARELRITCSNNYCTNVFTVPGPAIVPEWCDDRKSHYYGPILYFDFNNKRFMSLQFLITSETHIEPEGSEDDSIDILDITLKNRPLSFTSSDNVSYGSEETIYVKSVEVIR